LTKQNVNTSCSFILVRGAIYNIFYISNKLFINE
jgi:hypothetical protein